jgi:hypothetical protein
MSAFYASFPPPSEQTASRQGYSPASRAIRYRGSLHIAASPRFSVSGARHRVIWRRLHPTQLGVFIGQTLPHFPQFFASLFRLTSQPFAPFLSQSANPMLQDEIPHWPLRQAPMALAKLQAIPQAPQLATSVARLFSQPSAAFLLQSP